ncbi:class I SAM-dependent methyltransferase [Laceyella putida]|uniref:Class I SAM-dependent methyltransferase n=1 Tax=Laceyella putida TaxID=110101 RepID=A0ABW2RL11_9BACL
MKLSIWASLTPQQRLEHAQQIITRFHQLRPHSYYIDKYRDAEADYWFPILHQLDSQLSKGPQQKVLDVGPAYGTLLLYAALWGAKGYGMDMYHQYWSKELEQNYSIEWAQKNIEADDIPWKEPFDVILFTEVLEHMNYHPGPVFRKFFDALKPGGVLFLTTPWARAYASSVNPDLSQMPHYQPGMQFTDDEHKYYSLDEIMWLAKDAGFTASYLDIYKNHLLLVLKRPEA